MLSYSLAFCLHIRTDDRIVLDEAKKKLFIHSLPILNIAGGLFLTHLFGLSTAPRLTQLGLCVFPHCKVANFPVLMIKNVFSLLLLCKNNPDLLEVSHFIWKLEKNGYLDFSLFELILLPMLNLYINIYLKIITQNNNRNACAF